MAHLPRMGRIFRCLLFVACMSCGIFRRRLCSGAMVHWYQGTKVHRAMRRGRTRSQSLRSLSPTVSDPFGVCRSLSRERERVQGSATPTPAPSALPLGKRPGLQPGRRHRLRRSGCAAHASAGLRTRERRCRAASASSQAFFDCRISMSCRLLCDCNRGRPGHKGQASP